MITNKRLYNIEWKARNDGGDLAEDTIKLIKEVERQGILIRSLNKSLKREKGKVEELEERYNNFQSMF